MVFDPSVDEEGTLCWEPRLLIIKKELRTYQKKFEKSNFRIFPNKGALSHSNGDTCPFGLVFSQIQSCYRTSSAAI